MDTSFDLDINNYSIDDLIKFFKLQMNYNTLQYTQLDIQTIQQLDSIDEYVCNYKHHADKIF